MLEVILILLAVGALLAVMGYDRLAGVALTGARLLIAFVLILFLLILFGVFGLA